MKRHIYILVLLLSVVGASGQTNRTLEVYPLQGADPAAMEEATRALAGPEGRVIPDPRGGRLLVIATPEDHTRVHAALKQTALPRKNVQLVVDIASSADEQEAGGSLEGGISVGPGGTDWRLRPRVSQRARQQTGHTQQMLVTLSGTEASLRVGTQIPYLEWTVAHARHHPLITIGTGWQDVGAFLVFRPVIMPDGETIQIELTPEIRGRAQDDRASIRFAALASTLVARSGQTVTIADWTEANTIYQQFLLGIRSKTGQRSLDIQVTPQILSP